MLYVFYHSKNIVKLKKKIENEALLSHNVNEDSTGCTRQKAQ